MKLMCNSDSAYLNIKHTQALGRMGWMDGYTGESRAFCQKRRWVDGTDSFWRNECI